MRDPRGTPVFTPPRPSVLSANRVKDPAALAAFLAHAHGEPSPAAVKAERVQADQRQLGTVTPKQRLAETAADPSSSARAQKLVDRFGEAPFAADKALRELGFNDKMIAAVRRDHPVTNPDGSIDSENARGQTIHMPKAVSSASIGPALAGNNALGHFLGKVTGTAGKAASQLGSMAVQAGPGLIHLLATGTKALAESDRVVGPGQTPPDDSQMKATAELGHIAKGTAQQVGQDFAHPLRNPGYLAVDLGSALSLGAAGVARGAAAGRAATIADGASEATGASRLARAGRTGAAVARNPQEALQAFLERPAPQAHTITVRGQHGPVTVDKALSENPLVRPLQRSFYGRVEKKLNSPAGPTRTERFSAPKEQGGFAIPKPVAKVLAAPGDLGEHVFGAKAVLRRGLGVQRRTEKALLGAPAEEIRAAAGTRLPGGINAKLPASMRRGLSPAEDKAIQAVSILGKHAVVNPEQAVSLLRGYHLRAAAKALEDARNAADQASALKQAGMQLLNEGRLDELAQVEHRIAELEGEHRASTGAHERHNVQATQFEATLPVLKAAGEGAASSKFMDVLPQAHALAERRKELLASHVSPESAAFREAAPAEVYRQGPDAEHPLHTETPVVRTSASNPEAQRIHGNLTALDDQIAKVHDEYRRSMKRQRPMTAAEARLEHDRLASEHEKMLQSYEKRLMEQDVKPEQAQALLREHDGATAAAAQELERVKALPLGQLGFGSGGKTEQTLRMEKAAKITVAERRLKRLQRERGRFVDAVKTGKLRMQYDAAETARRNLRRQSGGLVVPTLKEEARAEIEARLERVLHNHADDPSVKPIAERLARLEQLKGGLRLHDEAHDPLIGTGKRLTAEELTHHFGTVGVGADETARTRLGALHEYRTSLEGMLEKALGHDPEAKTVLDETMLTRKELPPVEGAFRSPLGSTDETSFGSPYAAPYPGKGGIPPVDAKRRDSAIGHEFTAGEIKHGDLTSATVDAMANTYLKAARIATQEHEYDRYWKLSKPVRESENQVPVREPKNIPLEFKQELKRLADRPEAVKSLAELEQHVGEAFDRYLRGEEVTAAEKQQLADLGLPDGLWRKNRLGQSKVIVPVGTDLSRLGIRWVDKDYLEAPRTPRPRGKGMAAVDFLNDLGRLGVYARGGYILNLPSNFAMQALEQGFLAPQMYKRAFDVRERYGNELASKIEAQVGEGRARSYNIEHGGLGNATGTLASMWSSLIDRHSRVSAFLYWAKRHGVDLDDTKAVADLFKPENRVKLEQIRERANKGMVQFDNLAPLERDVLRHLIYFYPWVSRASAWAVRTMVEHPHKTFALGQLARIAQANQQRDFGKLPKSLEQRGYMPFKVFGKTYMIGTASVNPLQTISDTGHQLASPFDPSQPQLSESASPALSFALDELTGRDSQGHKLKGGRLKAGIMDTVVSGTPQGQALQKGLFGKRVARALGKKTDYSHTPVGQKPSFTSFGPGAALGGLTIGGLMPRATDMEAVHAKQHDEALAALPPIDRARARSEDRVQGLVQVAKHAGLEPGASPELQHAFKVAVARDVSYAEEAQKIGVAVNRLNQSDRLKADLTLLAKMGILDDQAANDAYDQYQHAGDAAIKKLRKELSRDYFQLGIISTLRRELHDAGYVTK